MSFCSFEVVGPGQLSIVLLTEMNCADQRSRGGGEVLTNIGHTGICCPIGSSFSRPNSGTGYPLWPWTLGLGIIFA